VTTTTRRPKSGSDSSVENDDRFKFGPAPIQTPQDALTEFLRESITEEEFRAVLARFGTLPGDLLTIVATPPERPDAAFKRSIPDDLVAGPLNQNNSLEVHQKQIAEKQAIKDEASKLAENDKTREETIQRESNPEFANDLAAKHITDPREHMKKES
jgi:hypothetical protein